MSALGQKRTLHPVLRRLRSVAVTEFSLASRVRVTPQGPVLGQLHHGTA